jgi:hypothetical protein
LIIRKHNAGSYKNPKTYLGWFVNQCTILNFAIATNCNARTYVYILADNAIVTDGSGGSDLSIIPDSGPCPNADIRFDNCRI